MGVCHFMVTTINLLLSGNFMAVYNIRNINKNYATTLYFRGAHLPYAFLAIMMQLIFVLTPTLIIIAYPSNCVTNVSLSLQSTISAHICGLHHP